MRLEACRLLKGSRPLNVVTTWRHGLLVAPSIFEPKTCRGAPLPLFDTRPTADKVKVGIIYGRRFDVFGDIKEQMGA